MLPYVPNESIHRERQAQEATHKAKENTKNLLKNYEKLQERTEKDILQDRLNLEADKKVFPGDEISKLICTHI